VDSNRRPKAYEAQNQLRLLKKLSVTQIAELSKLSKSYISQVKHGSRPPSKRLLEALFIHSRGTGHEHISLFLRSREAMGVSLGTAQFYRTKLNRFLHEVNVEKARRQDIELFLLKFGNHGNRHAYYRAIKTFYNWREETFNLSSPMKHLKAPKLSKLILPSLTREQVAYLIDRVDNDRDRAVIAMFTESGLRLTELVNVRFQDIDWETGTVRVMGKGRKEALAPLGKTTRMYLKRWLEEYQPDGGNIWGFDNWGVVSMLRRLRSTTGLPCNPHTFRRTFACLLRKAGLDVMTIKDLGRWESLEMVQRYTQAVTFSDSLKFYKAPLS
jgi:integrase/recombinase XerD